MKLKVCGLKYKENIEAVAELNPDYVGFIFYEHSRRYVGKDFIMPEIPSHIKKVGVFVNADLQYIVDNVKKYNLDLVQLSGNEAVTFCSVLRRHIKIPIIKAFGIDEYSDFDVLTRYELDCDYFLFDTKTNAFGGSGRQFNWDLLKKYNGKLPFFLSGGIELELQIKHPYLFAIDVNSRFETEMGVKDIDKLKQLIKIKSEIGI